MPARCLVSGRIILTVSSTSQFVAPIIGSLKIKLSLNTPKCAWDGTNHNAILYSLFTRVQAQLAVLCSREYFCDY